jgi:hypothetical protein
MTASARPWADVNSGTILEPIAPQHLGRAVIEPAGAFEAGSFASFTLTYTAGTYGIDDSGAVRVCFRFATDQTPPQFTDPTAPGYTTVEASNGAVLHYVFDRKANVRPWDRTLYIKVVKGYLKEGDRIVVRFGVTDHGSPGMRLQTFCEDTFEFRVLVDPIATFNFQPVPDQPVIAVVPGPPDRYVAVLPTLRRVGETFALRLKGEDRWGNPSDRCDVTLRLRATAPVDGLPGSVTLTPGARAFSVEGLSTAAPGDVRIDLLDEAGAVVAESNPLRIVAESPFRHYWGDLHGQSEETIGTNSAGAYFRFARDLAFVDACAHQGNDFQITAAFWAELNRITAELNQPGRFVTLPGYEWSGNTALGGDRNVYFPQEGRTIRRSSHALIEDRVDLDTDCTTAADLFAAFADHEEWDVVGFAHCGGRYADIRLAHDGRFERSVEVHSAWGTFEWLVHDAFDLGHRVGIVANSDGHKGRPGASYAGAGEFGAIGGLTCYLMPELTRDALLDCLKKRRHYATSGGPAGRMVIDVEARFGEDATIYHDDPALDWPNGQPAGRTGRTALMGDIVQLPRGEVELFVDILAAAPIERVDLFNGRELIETIRPYGAADLGSRIRVLWEGAEYRGRAREVIWDGSATFAGDSVLDATAINFFNRDKTLDRVGEDGVAWRSLTTGNFAGFDARLADGRKGRLVLDTKLVKADLPLAEIGLEDHLFEADGILPRFVRVFRLPNRNPTRAMRFSRRIRLKAEGDNPLWLRLTQEDGTRAWTSPIYVFR